MISYIGGKSLISRWIGQYIPRDIEVYVEPFAGMFWNFFRMDLGEFKSLKKVVYNDINSLNSNLFNCVRNYNKFSQIISEYQSQDKNLFYSYQKELFGGSISVDPGNPDYDLGAKYAYILTQVWSGVNPETGKFIDLKGKYKSKFDSFKGKLTNPKWQRYFDKIDIVSSLDFKECIDKYDSKSTYFYCDPPYYKTEKYYSNHDFGLSSHEELSNKLQSINGRFGLSYYEFDKLKEWFPLESYIWESKEFNKAAMATSGKPQTKGRELLIMNYGPNI